MLQDIQRELQQERNEHQQDQSKIDELQQADLQLRKAHADVLTRKEHEIQQRAIEYHQLADKAYLFLLQLPHLLLQMHAKTLKAQGLTLLPASVAGAKSIFYS